MKNVLSGFIKQFINVLSRTITETEFDVVQQLMKKATLETIEYIEQNNLTRLVKRPGNQSLFGILKGRLNDGIIIEFGVNKGGSINRLADLFPDRKIYGFDSFEGLPEDWTLLAKHDYDNEGRLPNVRKNVTLIKGLIQDTLPEFEDKSKIALIHIDTDLYSAAKTIFEVLGNSINNTYIVFDEYWNFPGWKEEEHKAFMEFINKSKKKFHYLAHNGFTNVLVKVE